MLLFRTAQPMRREWRDLGKKKIVLSNWFIAHILLCFCYCSPSFLRGQNVVVDVAELAERDRKRAKANELQRGLLQQVITNWFWQIGQQHACMMQTRKRLRELYSGYWIDNIATTKKSIKIFLPLLCDRGCNGSSISIANVERRVTTATFAFRGYFCAMCRQRIYATARPVTERLVIIVYYIYYNNKAIDIMHVREHEWKKASIAGGRNPTRHKRQ